jgi:hypothetical protein
MLIENFPAYQLDKKSAYTDCNYGSGKPSGGEKVDHSKPIATHKS